MEKKIIEEQQRILTLMSINESTLPDLGAEKFLKNAALRIREFTDNGLNKDTFMGLINIFPAFRGVSREFNMFYEYLASNDDRTLENFINATPTFKDMMKMENFKSFVTAIDDIVKNGPNPQNYKQLILSNPPIQAVYNISQKGKDLVLKIFNSLK